MKMLTSKKGFTLIELMIVVAIIGILAAIAIPQFANLVSKSQEGATKGNLGSLRSALSIYYGDTEGWYPTGATALNTLTVGARYLAQMPALNLPRTINSAGHGTGIIGTTLGAMAAIGDPGTWYYDNTGQGAGSNFWGTVVVGCTHKDIRGTVWTSF
jgi:prepilin-type N-terminal cleavage/methylation domain-containing protein